MLTRLSKIDKVSIVALAKQIEKKEGTTTISALADQLGVSLMSENRNRAALVERLTRDGEAPVAVGLDEPLVAAKKLIGSLMERSGALSGNRERASYPPWFKDQIVELNDQGHTYSLLSSLTGISVETLTGFRATQASRVFEKGSIDTLSLQIAAIWAEAPQRFRKNLDSFWYYLGKKHPDVSISSERLRQTLINLGLRYPRGPKTKDIGTQVKRPFEPHAIWEGDGKQIKICLNGREHVYSWYAFVDQNTTLIIGSAIEGTESSVNFLNALKSGKFKAGMCPIGILIDNRLSDEDMSPINDFCKQHNIVLVRTFPGNSKSNGNIENNFSLFESLVGPINLFGNADQIARQVAELVIEIFTGLRNNSRRPRLHGKTPKEAAQGARRPENTRSAIERMSNRFDREIKDIDFKWELIEPARQHFGHLSEESELKIKRLLSKYPVMDIIAAQAAYLAQIAKYPDNTYLSEYFMAIMRHKRESIAKHTYNESYRASIVLAQQLDAAYTKSAEEYAMLVVDELSKLPEFKTPSERMLHLDTLCWWLVRYSSKNSLRELWRRVGDLSETNRAITLRWWQQINEYVSERIGALMFFDLKATERRHSLHKRGFGEVGLSH